MMKWRVQGKSHSRTPIGSVRMPRPARGTSCNEAATCSGGTSNECAHHDEGSNQIRASCSLDFLNEIRGQKADSFDSSQKTAISFNPDGTFDQGSTAGTALSPVTPPPRHRYISPERRGNGSLKETGSTPVSNASTPTPAKAVFILQKSESRESVHIDVSIVNDADVVCSGIHNDNNNKKHSTCDSHNGDTNGNLQLANASPQLLGAKLLAVRSTEVCDEDPDMQHSSLDHFKFSRTRSMRGPKGLRISKVYNQARDANIADSTTAALTFSSEDEGKGLSDQSESPPPLPPRRHRSRPATSLSSYRCVGVGGPGGVEGVSSSSNGGVNSCSSSTSSSSGTSGNCHHKSALDTNSISSEESFPSIPCLTAVTDLHRLRVTGDVPPCVPPKSPLITRIEVTGEPVKPTVISTEGVTPKVGISLGGLGTHHHHGRSRSEVLDGTAMGVVHDTSKVVMGSAVTVGSAVKTSQPRLPPVALKKNNRTKSSDNIVRKNRSPAKKISCAEPSSGDFVDEGIVLSAPTKGRSHSAGRNRKLSEEIECYNVYNVRTGKITTSVQKPNAQSQQQHQQQLVQQSATVASSSSNGVPPQLSKRAERHQNCKKCIHALKS